MCSHRLGLDLCVCTWGGNWRDAVLGATGVGWKMGCHMFVQDICDRFGLPNVGQGSGGEIEGNDLELPSSFQRRSDLLKHDPLHTSLWEHGCLSGKHVGEQPGDDAWPSGVKAFQIIVDNQALADEACGRAIAGGDAWSDLRDISSSLAAMVLTHGWSMRKPVADPVVWRPRHLNKEADFLANIAMEK